ncbi:MAG: tetratricopeptide repeat protein [Kamptonema sp. SIO4C4]|nr:tetratricopeptide repeat protein [Kamptonema sp. SIO4C4]
MKKNPIPILCLALLLGMGTTSLTGLVPSPVVAQTTSRNNEQLNDLLRRGRDLADSGNYQQAIATYQQAANLDRRNPKIYSGIGYLYAVQGRFQEAAQAYRNALFLDRNNSAFYYAYAHCLAQMGDNRNATTAYRHAIQLQPDHIDSYLGLGVVLMRQGYHDRALDVYKRVVNLNPPGGEVYGLMATALLEQNQTQSALNLLRQATQRYPNNSKLWMQLGIFLLGLEDNDQEALNALQRAANLDPRNPYAQLQIGRILRERGQEEAADRMFYRVIALDNSVDVQLDIGDELMQLEAYLPAIVAYRRATQLAPDNPDSYYRLGWALYSRQREREASQAWEKALQIYRQQGNNTRVRELEDLLGMNQPRSPDFGTSEFVPFN